MRVLKMRNVWKGSAKLFFTLLLSHFLFFLPANAEMFCGADCCCGCRAGGPCTCQAQGEDCDNQEAECCPQEQWVYCQSSTCQYCYGKIDRCGVLRPAIINQLQLNEPCCNGGIWMPEDAPLFRPFIADPRQLTYSAGWRFNDDAATKNIIDVSFGDSFGIYRWCDVGPRHGQLQIDLEGGLWAIFNPSYDSAPLVNADYYVGIPITYAFDSWQFRLRGYHISSHVGDEFLLNHIPGYAVSSQAHGDQFKHRRFVRKNPSAEYLDFFISHDLTQEIRLYAGLGWVVEQDPSFHFHKFYSALGAELRLLRWGFLDCRNVLYGCPIFGMHFRGGRDFKRHIDATYVLGYEIGKLTGVFRRFRVFMEYHDGYSLEGQFCKFPTNYFSLRMSYGY